MNRQRRSLELAATWIIRGKCNAEFHIEKAEAKRPGGCSGLLTDTEGTPAGENTPMDTRLTAQHTAVLAAGSEIERMREGYIASL